MIPRAVILGEFQTGKSTLISCLLGGRVATVGNGLPTTRLPVLYRFDQANFVFVRERKGGQFETSLEDFVSGLPEQRRASSVLAVASLYSPLLRNVEILDTPGFGSGPDGDEVARHTAGMADFPLVVMTKGFPSGRESLTGFLRAALSGRQYGLVLNCGLECPADPRSEACARIEQDLRTSLLRLGLLRPALSCRVNLGRIYREVICSTIGERTERTPALMVLKECGFEGLREKLVRRARRNLKPGKPESSRAPSYRGSPWNEFCAALSHPSCSLPPPTDPPRLLRRSRRESGAGPTSR